MIPLRDENPTRTFPFVVVLLLLANVFVYAYQWLLSDARQIAFIYSYSLIPAVLLGHLDPSHALAAAEPAAARALLANGVHLSPLQPGWLAVFTAMFMHAGGIHLGSNMLYLWIFGNNIEDALGHFRFLLFYLFCGVVAAGLQVFMSAGSPLPMLGASGAIAGVLGAYYVRFPTARILTLVWFFITYIPASVVLFLWFLLQVVQSVGALGMRAQGGVAVFAHVGGFAAGWFLMRLFPGPRREQRYWR